MNCLITHSMVQSIYTYLSTLPFLILQQLVEFHFILCVSVCLFGYIHENITKFILTTKLFVIVIDIRISLNTLKHITNNYDDIQ